MGVLWWLFIGEITILIGIFICLLTSFLYSLFVKRRLKFFIQKANEDLLLKALLKEISSRNIGVVPLELFSELIFMRKAKMSSFPASEISISNSLIKKFLKDAIDKNMILLDFGHELGHFNQTIFAPFGNCKIEKDCLYEEMLATKSGVEIIENLSQKEIKEVIQQELLSLVAPRVLKQCRKCISFLIARKCPLFQELEKLGVVIQNEEISLKVF